MSEPKERLPKMKASLSPYSSITGSSLLLHAENGRVLAQVALMVHDPDLRTRKMQEGICAALAEAFNSRTGEPEDQQETRPAQPVSSTSPGDKDVDPSSVEPGYPVNQS